MLTKYTRASIVGLIASTLLLSAGCASTWVKRAGAQPAQPVETLNASLTLTSRAPGQTNDSSGDSAKALVTMVQNKDLDKFGERALEMTQEALLKRGYQLTLDKERAVRLGDSSLAKNKDMQTLSGFWTHPQTSPYAFNGTFFESSLVKVAQTLQTPDKPQEHFASITLYVYEDADWACGSIIGWFFPVVTMDVRILNNKGKEIFNSRVRGEGDSSFAVADRSPANLELALKRALMKMNALEVESL